MTEHDDIRASITNLTDAVSAEAAARSARESAMARLLDLVTEMRRQAGRANDRSYLAVVRHLYWQHTVIRSSDLAKAAGFTHPGEMTVAVGAVPSGIVCDYCQQDIPRTSRSWKPPTRLHGGMIRCETCWRADREASSRQYQIDRLRERHVDDGPVPAPVTDWLVATRLVLAYPPIGAVDPDDEYLSGLWRSYELAQRADERISGLSTSHATIPAGEAAVIVQKALKVVGWDVGRTWEVVTPLAIDSPTVILTRLTNRIKEVREQRSDEALTKFPDDYAADWD